LALSDIDVLRLVDKAEMPAKRSPLVLRQLTVGQQERELEGFCQADELELRRGRQRFGDVPSIVEGLLAGLVADRSQFYKDLAVQFYGANRPGAEVSQGILDEFWTWSMQSGLKNSFESVKSLSESDFTEDLEKFDMPTLLLHGEDDQVVPVRASSVRSARIIKDVKEIYYPGAPHGITATHQDQVNAELLAFLQS
jgi:pimeloyl-ACP methyl ester carboxylesterase